MRNIPLLTLIAGSANLITSALVVYFLFGVVRQTKLVAERVTNLVGTIEKNSQRVPPPICPAAVPNPPAPPVLPVHINYTIVKGDHTMYALYRAHCMAVGFEKFQADMLELNRHELSPRKIPDGRALARIKIGQEWWFPPYCKKFPVIAPLHQPEPVIQSKS